MAETPLSNTTRSSGLLLVFSGPSGVGKTSIAHEIMQRLNGHFSISATTRSRGKEEIDGRDYRFLSHEDFQLMIDNDAFLEYAEVFGRDLYGTPRDEVETHLENGDLVILYIDVQGALQVRTHQPDALMIFILPPSEQELVRRLTSRGRDDEDAMKARLAAAMKEIELAHSSGAYDAFVVNKNFDSAVQETIDLIIARKCS